MQLVYKLNLPPLDQWIRQDIMNIHDDDKSENTIMFRNCHDLFITNTICGIEFSNILYLKKTETEGWIHSDSSANEFHFGINFNTLGRMTLKYWLPEDVELKNSESVDHKSNINYKNKITYPVYQALREPYKTYILEPNSVYLVNATVPHSGNSVVLKKSYSLRTTDKERQIKKLDNWETVVNTFKSLIIL